MQQCAFQIFRAGIWGFLKNNVIYVIYKHTCYCHYSRLQLALLQYSSKQTWFMHIMPSWQQDNLKLQTDFTICPISSFLKAVVGLNFSDIRLAFGFISNWSGVSCKNLVLGMNIILWTQPWSHVNHITEMGLDAWKTI